MTIKPTTTLLTPCWLPFINTCQINENLFGKILQLVDFNQLVDFKQLVDFEYVYIVELWITF